MLEELQNGSSTDLSSSSGDGSGGSGSGSGGSANGSGGSVDGSGGSVDGSGGSDSGSDNGNDRGNDGNGSDNVDGNSDASNGNERESSESDEPLRASRSERERARQPIRLRPAVSGGHSNSAIFGRTGNAGDGQERDNGDYNEPVIRLGANQRGRPRKVNVSESATTDFKISQSKDVVKMFIDSVFTVPAVMLNQDFWKLDKDESKMLCDAVIQWLESMPKSRQSKVALFINENMPLINLVMVALFIISDRVKASMAQFQVEKAARSFRGLDASVPNIDPNLKKSSSVGTPLDSMFNGGFTN